MEGRQLRMANHERRESFFFGVVVSEADLVLCFSSLVFSAVLVCFTEKFVFLFLPVSPSMLIVSINIQRKLAFFVQGNQLL